MLHHFHFPLSNVFVALVAVGFTYIFLKVKHKFLKIIFGVVWFLFLPNTAYLFTDTLHIIPQWHSIPVLWQFPFAVLYSIAEIIGIVTFVFAVLPFERIIKKVSSLKKHTIISLIIFNSIIGFGVVLGRWEHINSYVVFTNPVHVLESVTNIVTSSNLLGLTLLLGLVCNGLYFLCRKKALLLLKKIL